MRGLLVIAAIALTSRAAAADTPELDARHTATLGFGMGALEIGDNGGVVDPIVHAATGLVSGRFELEVLADWAPWFDGRDSAADTGAPRRVLRAGTAARWDFARPEHDDPRVAMMGYAELGMGWEHVSSALGSADRGDLEVGVGLEELFLWNGHASAGLDLSLRGLVAPATDGVARIVAQAPGRPAGGGIDVGVMFDLGVVIRR